MSEDKKISELDAMTRLAEIMNDSPTQIEIGGKVYKITALKMGTQVLIAEETCKIQKNHEGNMVDLFNQFARSLPAVIRCLAYAVLNDKDKIYKDYATKEFSNEFYALCEQIEWESDKGTWMSVLVEVIRKIDMQFFFTITAQMTELRTMTLRRIQEQ
jgi:hypothetical protein